jgi:hypothetical protein
MHQSGQAAIHLSNELEAVFPLQRVVVDRLLRLFIISAERRAADVGEVR